MCRLRMGVFIIFSFFLERARMGSSRILVLGLLCFWPFLFSHPGVVHIFVLSVYGRAYDLLIVFGCVYSHVCV